MKMSNARVYPRWAQIQMFRQHVHVSKDHMHLQVAFI